MVYKVKMESGYCICGGYREVSMKDAEVKQHDFPPSAPCAVTLRRKIKDSGKKACKLGFFAL